MFKRLYFKHLISDIIFAAGIFLLSIGVFYLVQSNSISKSDKVMTALEKQDDLQLDKEIQLSVTDKAEGQEMSRTGNLIPDNTIEDQISELPLDKIDKEKTSKFSLIFSEEESLYNIPLEIKLEDKSEDLMVLTQYNDNNGINDTINRYFKEKNNFFSGNIKSGEFDKKEKVTIIIPEGSSGQEVAHIFGESNLMTYNEFIQLLLLFNIETRLKAGKYSFDSDSSVSDILSKILIK